MRSRFHRAALLLMAPVLPCLAQAETHTVRIEDMQFVPATISVKAGDRIVVDPPAGLDARERVKPAVAS